MLVTMLGIFGLFAYVAYPKANSSTVPQRFTAVAASSSITSSSSSSQTAPPSTVTVVVGAHAAGSADLALLDHLLPLTNFSSLSSAQVLDAAAAKGLDQQQLRQLMQLQQELYCSAKMHLTPLAGTTKV